MLKVKFKEDRVIIKTDFSTYSGVPEDAKAKFKSFFTFNPDDKTWYTKIYPTKENISFVRTFIESVFYKKIDKLEIETEIKYPELNFHYLYPFQNKAISMFFYFHRKFNEKGAGFFWDVGLGKTITSITLAKEIQKEKDNLKILILCPKALIHQWKNEILKFGVYDKKDIAVIHGRNRNIEEIKKIGITTYETFRTDFINGRVPDVKNLILILDEASKIKNSKAKITKLVKKVGKEAYYTIVLTATPFETSVMNYWNIISSFTKRISWKEFSKNYVVYKWNDFANRYLPVKGKNYPLFKARLSGLADWKRKADVKKDLPKVNEIDLMIDLSPEQKKVISLLLKQTEGKVFPVFTLIRLAQNGIKEIRESESEIISGITIPKEKSVPKLDELGSLFDELGNNQVLIFTSFERSANRIKDYLKERNINVETYTGSSKNEEVIEKFRNGDLQVLVATDSLAYGVDFPDVDYMINYDYHPNPAKIQQRIGRINRITSKNPKTIINMISSIDKRLKELAMLRKTESEIIYETIESLKKEYLF